MLKMKAISSGVLAAIMLFVSCAAAKCEITCGIAGFSRGCHSSEVGPKASEQKSDAGAMADMPGMDNESSPNTAMSATPNTGQISSSGCAAPNCQHQANAPQSELNEVKWKPSLATVAVLAVFYSFHDVCLSVLLPASSETPPVLPLDPLSQSSILRV